MNLIIRIFQIAQKVTENGLIAFQGMCVGLADRIELSEINRYLTFSLQQDDECPKLTCGIIADLSNSIGSKLDDYIDHYVPHLHTLLQSESVERKIKLAAIHVLGSLSLNSGDRFNSRYLNDTIQIFNLAA